MVDKNACAPQQWWGNTINSGLYHKKKDLPSVSNILWVFHSHSSQVIRV